MNSTSPLASLESYLRLTSVREQMIATNMANVDTPGYRTKDINFAEELQRAARSETLDGSNPAPVVREVQGLMERPDGNNVSLDREGLLMSATQLQYQAGVQLIKRHFHNLLSAINGGTGQ